MTSSWEPPEDDRAPLPFAPPVSGQEGPGGSPFALASYGRRVAGYLIDTVVMILVIWVAAALTTGPLRVVLVLLLTLAYPWLMIAFAGGQTLGMKAIRIVCVEDGTGAPVGVARSLGRSAAAMVFIVGGGLIYSIPTILDLLWPAWDKKRQALHDKVAGTVVIVAPAAEPTVVF